MSDNTCVPLGYVTVLLSIGWYVLQKDIESKIIFNLTENQNKGNNCRKSISSTRLKTETAALFSKCNIFFLYFVLF